MKRHRVLTCWALGQFIDDLLWVLLLCNCSDFLLIELATTILRLTAMWGGSGHDWRGEEERQRRGTTKKSNNTNEKNEETYE